MNPFTFFEALQLRLEASGATEVKIYANQSGDGVTPRYEVYAGPVNNRTNSLDGGTDLGGLAQINAVVEDGTYTTGIADMVQHIIDTFPVNATLAGAIITDLPEPASPITEGGEYRIPITIRYRATS